MNIKQVKGILTGNPGKLHCPENAGLIRKCAAEGMVLLENNGVLPLTPGKIALYGAGARGTMYCGTGSGYVFTAHVTSVEEGLVNAGFTLATADWLNRCADREKKVNKADKTIPAGRGRS